MDKLLRYMIFKMNRPSSGDKESFRLNLNKSCGIRLYFETGRTVRPK